jgi:hypothetical protein
MGQQFHPLVQRACDLLAERPSVYVEPWTDQVIDSPGHDPHAPYCGRSDCPLSARASTDWGVGSPSGLLLVPTA